MSWEWIIGAVVMIMIVLVIWAKVSNQTIGDVIRDISDFIGEKKDSMQDKAIEVVTYD